MRVGYLGPEGTFTEEALLTLFGPGAGVEGVPYMTVADCFAAVASGDVPQALVPMENSIEGSVPQTLDQLAFGPQFGQLLQSHVSTHAPSGWQCACETHAFPAPHMVVAHGSVVRWQALPWRE